MATNSSILARRIPWTEKLGGVTHSQTTETNTFTFFQVTSLILFLAISISYIFSLLLALKFLTH